MNEVEALDRAIHAVQVDQDQRAENLYGRRYKDRSKHPERDAIEEILAVDTETINVLTALRERLAGGQR